jgi:curved DNA-binding protein CbpA
MDETFYSILGVSKSADTERINRAYRERVKDNHPDVSEDPEATQNFKKLTTARDVLVDEQRRQRYDDLGHNTFVREHLDGSVWEARAPTNSATSNGTSSNGPGTSGATRTTVGDPTDGWRRTYEARQQAASTNGGSANGPSVGRSSESYYGSTQGSYGSKTPTGNAATGTGIGSSSRRRRTQWINDAVGPNASRVHAWLSGYWRTLRNNDRVDQFLQVTSALGPWLLFHVVFLVSAFLFVLFMVVYTLTTGGSVALIIVSVMIASVATFFSVVHLLLQWYS